MYAWMLNGKIAVLAYKGIQATHVSVQNPFIVNNLVITLYKKKKKKRTSTLRPHNTVITIFFSRPLPACWKSEVLECAEGQQTRVERLVNVRLKKTCLNVHRGGGGTGSVALLQIVL